MCCFFTTLVLLGPRLAILVWWLVNRSYVGAAFSSWLWGLLGWLFLPWTTIAFLIFYPGGINGLEWLWLGLGLLVDLGSYGGGGWGNRDRLRG
jgi:hypothetical protein